MAFLLDVYDPLRLFILKLEHMEVDRGDFTVSQVSVRMNEHGMHACMYVRTGETFICKWWLQCAHMHACAYW